MKKTVLGTSHTIFHVQWDISNKRHEL